MLMSGVSLKEGKVSISHVAFFDLMVSRIVCKLDTKAEELFNRTVIFIDEDIKPIVGDMKKL